MKLQSSVFTAGLLGSGAFAHEQLTPDKVEADITTDK